ncbi:MAG TPA: molybdopterin-binding protein, partial [Flavisolibacter sp.]
MAEVNASIITIGDELLIGQTIDTNSAFIAGELNGIGIWVKRKITVGDVKDDILSALREQARDCRVIIITGGLGPTADDITKPALCEYFNTMLIENAAALENVTSIFSKLNRLVTEINRQQALVPECCDVLQNARGTAPGMWFEKDGVMYVSLPGVPHEMKGLLTASVIPRLKERLALDAVVHRTLLTAGEGESVIAGHLADFENGLPPHIRLAYLPSYGMVRLRLTGRGAHAALLEQEVGVAFSHLQSLVEKWLVAAEDITLQEAVRRKLKEHGKTLATAESCTGGYIASLVTGEAGASGVYKGS